MRKYLLLISLIGIGFQSSAQNRFFTSISGGPKVSYSQNVGYEIHNTAKKGSWQGGIYLGYKFKEEKYIAETGINFARFDILIHHTPDYDFFRDDEEPELNIAYSAWQIPLRIKANLLATTSKFQIRPIAGLLFTVSTSPLKNSLLNIPIDNQGYRTVQGKRDAIMVLIPHSSGGAYGKEFLVSVESGLEVGYKITDQINLIEAVRYQMGLNTADSFIMYYKYRETDDQDYTNIVTASSKAEALNFDIGIAYSFGKRKEAE